MPDVPSTEHMIETNGVTLRVLDAGSGPAVLLAHGFPELAYSWRHQIQPLVDAGYRVIVPDQRGYGGSSIPDEITDYDITHLTDDLAGVLDALGEKRRRHRRSRLGLVRGVALRAAQAASTPGRW